MSSFAINGRILFDVENGPTVLAQADAPDAPSEVRRRGVGCEGDPRLYALDLVAALALELRARGDHVIRVDVE